MTGIRQLIFNYQVKEEQSKAAAAAAEAEETAKHYQTLIVDFQVHLSASCCLRTAPPLHGREPSACRDKGCLRPLSLRTVS